VRRHTIPPACLRCATLVLLASTACVDDTMGPGVVSADHSFITVSRDTLVSGTLADLTLDSRDADGRRVVSGGHVVVFAASGGTSAGTVSGTTDRGDGTYTGTFTGTAAGTATTITATIDGTPVTQPLPTITVVPGPVAPLQTIVRASPRTILVGEQATLEVVIRDAAGNDVGRGGSQVAFLAAGGTSTGTIGPVTDHDDGHYTAPFTGTGAGHRGRHAGHGPPPHVDRGPWRVGRLFLAERILRYAFGGRRTHPHPAGAGLARRAAHFGR